MNDLCGISATPGRGNEEISVETRFRGQCRSQSWNPYGPVLGYRSRLLGFHRSLGSEAVSSSGVRWVPWVPTRARGRLPILSVLGPTFQSTIVDRMGRGLCHRRGEGFDLRDHRGGRDGQLGLRRFAGGGISPFAARENRLTHIISANRVLAGDGFAVDYFGRADMPSPASPQTLLALLDIEPPIVQAPMAGVSSPAMAAAVGNAGALGSIGVGAKAARSRRSGLGPRPTRPHCFVSPSFFSVSGFSVSVFALALLAACFLLCFL
jgi:hypothetical protein